MITFNPIINLYMCIYIERDRDLYNTSWGIYKNIIVGRIEL